jgi:ribosome biogenesis protein UTP30
MTPEQLRDNVEVVVSTLVEQYVPQQWKNVRTVHVKGPETAALPIWMTSELWADEADVLEEAPSKENPGKKRKRSALTNGEGTEVIEVPGPDGKMRRIEKPSKKGKDRTDADAVVAKAAESEKSHEDEVAKASEKAEKAARKEALKKQKELAKVQVTDGVEVKKETKEKKKASKKVKA